MSEAINNSRREQVRAMLDGVTDDQVHQLGVQAIRACYVKQQLPEISMHGTFGREFLLVLADANAARPLPTGTDLNGLKEVFAGQSNAMDQPWMGAVVEFLSWLFRSGLALPLHNGSSPYPTGLYLTRRGVRLIEDPAPDDNPLLPGFLERIKLRCPSLPDAVIALLVDARACFDVSLLRASIVMMGVAYELAIEEVLGVLLAKVASPALPANTLQMQARVRLSNVRAFIASPAHELLIADREQRRLIAAAYDFAELLRQRRNDAAHTRPAFDFTRAGETEEFLISAWRHLPALWSLGF